MHVLLALFLSLNTLPDQGNFETQVSSNSLRQPDCLIKCRCMETSKKKRGCGGAFHKDRREMCKAARSAKARKSVCDEQNKETIKRESVRDVTTPRAFHKLLGNFLATSRTSSNFSSYLLNLRYRSNF